MNNHIKIMTIALLSVGLSACAGFFDKDNTPQPTALTHFNPEARIQTIWDTRPNSGSRKKYLKLVPAVSDELIFTADRKGLVTAIDKTTGKTRWKADSGVVVSAGPAAGQGLVIVGSREGEVVALQQSDGSLAWKSKASSEIFAPPAITNHIVLVKAIDGKVSTFSTTDGTTRWQYQQTEPNLILRSASTPQIHQDKAVIGFANGTVAELTLQGNLLWDRPIATPEGSFAIQRMIDIDADPVVAGNRIYVATFQGRIAALDLVSGQTIWTQDISSYTGLTTDEGHVYISDANSHIWAFDKDNGRVEWRQLQLAARNITGPVALGNYIVVGDAEGYLHWLSKVDGHFVARVKVNRSGILATPVVSNNVLYVLAKDGHLAAYRVI